MREREKAKGRKREKKNRESKDRKGEREKETQREREKEAVTEVVANVFCCLGHTESSSSQQGLWGGVPDAQDTGTHPFVFAP